MKKTARMMLGLMIALSSFMALPTANAATAPQLTVDLSNLYRPVTHVASGSLYGLKDASTPALDLIAPLRPSTFVQMAPNGQQLPNGETQPSGDALKVSGLAAQAGAKVTIRMPDIYPNFPYKWVSWTDWLSKVDTMVNQTISSGATNIYAYELWNEPDGTWDTTNAGPFNDGWKRTYQEVRSLDPATRIVGPSISSYNQTFMSDFLTYCKANNCLPDIISWHQWDTSSIPSKIQQFTQLENQLGISPRPISINEYGWTQEEGVPGASARYIAQFERNGVESANMAFWFRPGRLSNLITDQSETNGGWWFYKWYGDMSGQMAMTTPVGTSLDGIASIDSSAQTVHVLYGGADGDNTVVVKGFASAPFFGSSVHVKAEMTPWYGVDTAVSAPTTVFEGDFAVVNGQISVPVSGMDKSYGYHLIITPAGTTKNRYEAENATINHANTFSNANASNGSYVGQIDYADSYVQFQVNAATAGAYNMQIRYANGGTANSTHQLSVNGGTNATVTYPVTGGWLYAGYNGTVTVNVNLNAGSNTIKFAKGTNYAELDEIQLTPVPPFDPRLEAEKSTVSNANIDASSYTSGQSFVGMINYANSYVQFTADVPTAGTYYMDIGFANGTSGNSTHLLSLNGGASTTVTYGSTGNWNKDVPNFGSRRIKSIPVTLNAGSNTIKLTYGGTGYAELDYIELHTDVTRYEAESATVNHANRFSNAAVSNGQYVGQIDYSDSYVQFNVNVPADGTYQVKIAYANGTSAVSTHNLSVNGGANTAVSYATTGGWLNTRAEEIKTVTVNLNAGANTLKFSNSGNGYTELDYIDVSK